MKKWLSGICGVVLLLIAGTVGLPFIWKPMLYKSEVLDCRLERLFTSEIGGPAFEFCSWLVFGLLIVCLLGFTFGGFWLLRRAFGTTLRAPTKKALFLIAFTIIHAILSFILFLVGASGTPMHPTFLHSVFECLAIVILCPVFLPIFAFAQDWLNGFGLFFFLIANSAIWAVVVLYGFGAARRFVQRRRARAL